MRRRSPLSGLRLALVGPGRVGGSLARWARDAGAAVEPVAGRSTLATFESAGADGLILAVPDAALAEVAVLLASRRQAPVALHVSGSQGASALAALRRAGAAVGSLHPLCAFPTALPTPPEGLVCGVDGDPPALALARRLAAALGAEAVLVAEDQRLLYHFGATLAAGGVATLLALAAELVHDLGLPDAVARGYRELGRGALGAFDPSRPAAAITGPVARGDSDLVTRELVALAERRADLEPLSRALAAAALDLIERHGGLAEAQRRLRRSLAAVP